MGTESGDPRKLVGQREETSQGARPGLCQL